MPPSSTLEINVLNIRSIIRPKFPAPHSWLKPVQDQFLGTLVQFHRQAAAGKALAEIIQQLPKNLTRCFHVQQLEMHHLRQAVHEVRPQAPAPHHPVAATLPRLAAIGSHQTAQVLPFRAATSRLRFWATVVVTEARPVHSGHGHPSKGLAVQLWCNFSMRKRAYLKNSVPICAHRSS